MVEAETTVSLDRLRVAESCDCLREVNALPAMRDSGNVLLINLFGPVRTFVSTYTEMKIRGKKPPLIAASFCPFCGTKYPAPLAVRKGASGPADG